MPIINRFADLHEDVVSWRHDFHQNPELQYDVHQTAASVVEKLKSFGVDEVVTGIGRTGLVGVIHGRREGRTIGLRADMDALPIKEATGKPYASKNEGVMHACGHDGHTAMLLGAARYLAETRNFAGRAIVIFQPAEEGGAGAKAMIDDGLFEKWQIDEVYGLHNLPGLDVGKMAVRPGPIMASIDDFFIELTGRGGHAALPHTTIDPVVVGVSLVQALQTLVARNVDPIQSGVVSVTRFHAGDATNVIDNSAHIAGTVRSLTPEVRDLLEKRIHEVAAGVAATFSAKIDVKYKRNYPITHNHQEQTRFAADVAREVVGGDNLNAETAPLMGGEDFAFMLEHKPGAYLFIGNGDTANVHNPLYDFNDDAIPYGCSFWSRLVETAMPL